MNDKIQINAVVDNLDKVISFIDQKLEEKSCSPKMQMQIELAVEEIFVNIANYAYENHAGTAEIGVEFREDPMSVTITFTDSGIPYDPLKRTDPDVNLPSKQRKIGGLGIYLTKKMADNIFYEYKNGQNILKFLKNL